MEAKAIDITVCPILFTTVYTDQNYHFQELPTGNKPQSRHPVFLIICMRVSREKRKEEISTIE